MTLPELEKAIADDRLLYQDAVCASFLHHKPRIDGHCVVLLKDGVRETLDKDGVWYLTRILGCTGKAVRDVLPNIQRMVALEMPEAHISYELLPIANAQGLVYVSPCKKELKVIIPEERSKIVSKLEQYMSGTAHLRWDKPKEPVNEVNDFLKSLPARFFS